jgi:uncharacterized protein YjgD (DUF1641 family)
MLDIFEKKDIDQFSKAIKNVFNLMSISRKYRVVGSASLKNIRFVADYDLNELFECEMSQKECLDKILHLFREKFKEAEAKPNVYITDFKCGENSNGDALRWDKDDIKKGYKIMDDKRKISFQECVLMKSTMKIDMIAFIDGRYNEFSDNYYIKIGDKANFFKHDTEIPHLLNNLAHDFSTYFYSKQNYYKALKRAFSYWLMEDKEKNKDKLTKLMNYFNSRVGLLYKLRGELDTIQLVMENKFRKPKVADIRTNLKIVLSQLQGFDLPKAKEHLENAIKAKSAKKMFEEIEKAKEIVFNAVNSSTVVFIRKNPEVILVRM